MFLDTIARRNPQLVRAAVTLHQAGEIPANSYVLDLDAVRRNALLIEQAADAARLHVYPMTKQVGRNPLFVRAASRAGMPKFVCVDWMEARLLARQKAQIGHVGHLVQIPRAEGSPIAALQPEVWTVFNLQKAQEASAAAQAAGRTQDLLLRVVRSGDTFYPMHDGGFDFETIADAAREIAALSHLRVVGVTSFPTLLFDPETRSVQLTPNMETLRLAADRLRREVGLEITQINAPGTTSAATMQMLSEAGATHVEPGHGFTGTTPWHAYADLPELPAICYLSEVSDLRGGHAYLLGGGFFVDPVIPPYQVRALVGKDGDQALDNAANAKLSDPAGIDYYALLDSRSAKVEIGDSAVFGFRAQAFATRAHVVPVRGISRNRFQVAGVYDTSGRRVRPWSAARARI
jgi:predicted amino acid racemase